MLNQSISYFDSHRQEEVALKVAEVVRDFVQNHKGKSHKIKHTDNKIVINTHCILPYLSSDFKDKFDLNNLPHSFDEDDNPSFGFVFTKAPFQFFMHCFTDNLTFSLNSKPSIDVVVEEMGFPELANEIREVFNRKRSENLNYTKEEEEDTLSPTLINTWCTLAHQNLIELIEDFGKTHSLLLKRFPYLHTIDDVKNFIERYKLGIFFDDAPRRELRQRLVIPYLDENGKCVSFTARALQNQSPKYWRAPGQEKMFYGLQYLDQALERGYIFLVEGELDAISIREAVNVPVLAYSGEGFTDAMKNTIHNLIKSNVIFYILGDPDLSGELKANKFYEFINQHNGIAFVFNIDEFRDKNEILMEEGKESLKQKIEKVLLLTQTNDSFFLRNELPELVIKRKKRKVFTSGLKELDYILGGGYYSGFHVVGGITAAGKTSFALNLALKNALQGNKVLFFSYEMPREQLWFRIIANWARDPSLYLKLRKGDITREEILKLISEPRNKIVKDIEQCDLEESYNKSLLEVAEYIKIFDGAGEIGTVAHIKNAIYQSYIEDLDYPLVIIDYLQRMPVPENIRHYNIRERIEYIVKELQRNIAAVFDVPIIVLSAISRSAYSTKNELEDIAGFRESSGIEYTAYTAIRLENEKKEKGSLQAKDNDESTKVVIIKVVKNREYGITGELKYYHDYKLNIWKFKVDDLK